MRLDDEALDAIGNDWALGQAKRESLARDATPFFPRWVEFCLRRLAAGGRVSDASLQDLPRLRLIGCEADIDPRPAMARVAALAHRVARPDMPLLGGKPAAGLAEDLLLQALVAGQPEPEAWAGYRSVKLPVLLVAKTRNAIGQEAETGLVARLKLRRVPVGRWRGEALNFVPAPTSFLLQMEREQQRNGDQLPTFGHALRCATEVLKRHLAPGAAAQGFALMWDLLPPAGCSLLGIGGNSAGAALALAGLYLMRDELAAGEAHAELRRQLRLIEWQRAAITAALAGTGSDSLVAIGGGPAKFGAWFSDEVAALRPTKVFVAQRQALGLHDELAVPCKHIAELSYEVARHTGGELTGAQMALLDDLLDARPAADPARLTAVYGESAPPSNLRAFLVQRYARWCAPDQTENQEVDPAQLDSRFVNLTLSEDADRDEAEGREPRETGAARGQQWDSLQQLLAAHPDTAGWLLVGQPGGGKTTLLQHHEATMARLGLQQLASGEAPQVLARCEAPQELCLWLRLKEFPATETDAGRWLKAHWQSTWRQMPDLDTLLDRYSVRFLFDGLNEIEAAGPAQRAQAVSRLVDWAAQQRKAHRMLAPIFSVREHHLGTLGSANYRIRTIHVQRWNDEQMAQYIGKLPGLAESGLWRRIRADPALKALSAVPINLAFQCALFRETGQLATSRAELFSGMTWLRLRREDERNNLLGDALLSAQDRQQIGHPTFWKGNLLSLPDEGALVRQLDAQGDSQLRGHLDANLQLRVRKGDVAPSLSPTERTDWLRAVQDLGLAEVDLKGWFSFRHQLWLEFFAARGFGRGSGALPRGLATPLALPLDQALARAAAAREALPLRPVSKWEEVLKMAVQLAADPGPLIERLIEVDAALAGRVAVARLQDLPQAGILQRLRQRLHDLSTDARVDLRLRVEAGLALGDLGDRIRYEERNSCLIPNAGHWVPIEGGHAMIGSDDNDDEAYDDEKPLTEVTVKPFRMAFAPVTNAEFKRFIEAGGYTSAEFWGPDDSDSMKWLRVTDRRQPTRWDDGDYNNPLQPVVGVCLWEAMAYCEWLTRKLGDGYRFRLPTEAEWEFAARGKQRHRYPWGDDAPTFDHCNHGVTHLWRTSPVGVFPKGDRQVGDWRLTDLAGNVWEWTSSRFTDRLVREALMTVTSHAEGNQVSRALRGGGWYDTARGVRGACRNRGVPHVVFNDGLGFRVVACPI